MTISNREMDTGPYLRRIGYRGSTRPSIDTLRKLHRRHLLSVPFENLDIHLGRPIILDQRSFYEKIVLNNRGGYCYELNGCFAWLLKNLGFNVSMLSARVARKDGSFSPSFDHMTLLVQLRERWLVDVGFGDLFTEPRQLDTADPQEDDGRYFQIKETNGARVLSRWDEETFAWTARYAFDMRHRKLADFTARNRYQQYSPQSHFTQGRLVSRLLPLGRVTLTDTRLIMTIGKRRIDRRIRNRREFDRMLLKHFHIQPT